MQAPSGTTRDARATGGGRRTSRRRLAPGFNLFEVTLVAVIIALLAALTFIAANRALNDPKGGVRFEAERLVLRALKLGIDEFRNKMGGLPPLVDDQTPIENVVETSAVPPPPARLQVRVRRGTATEPSELAPGRYLRYENTPFASSGGGDPSNPNGNGARFSVLTLGLFVLGAGDARLDGINGPGMTQVDPIRGWFTKTGPSLTLLFDTASVRERVRPAGTINPGNTEVYHVLDRWNRPIRYYRWEPTFHVVSASGGASCLFEGYRPDGTIGSAPANISERAGEIRSYNVPACVGNPWVESELRAARFALISPGPDGQIDERAGPDEGVNRDNIVEVGQ
jgi:type II secretory pathway pseudopilin PulG